MNILHIVPYFFIDWSGDKPVETVYGLAKAQINQGHSVTIYTTNAFNKKEKARGLITVDGIGVHEFESLGDNLGKKHHICISSSMIPALEKQAIKPDIIHLHEYRTFQNIIVHRYAQKHHIPYVLQAYGSLTTSFQKGRLKRIFDRVYGNRILRNVSAVIPATEREAQQYRDMKIDEYKIRIVPSGIDLAEFNNPPPRGEFRKRHGINDDQKIVLFLGRINKIKGLDILAKAFHLLSMITPNVKLVIAGNDDGYLKELKMIVAGQGVWNNTLFTGALHGRDKLRAYVDADVYVLPSVYETFGITILEAWACRTPVIVTDRCGIADIIDNKAGLVVPYDSNQLQESLLKMLSDDNLRKQFGETGRQLVYEKFNWGKIAEQMREVYENVIENNVQMPSYLYGEIR